MRALIVDDDPDIRKVLLFAEESAPGEEFAEPLRQEMLYGQVR